MAGKPPNIQILNITFLNIPEVREEIIGELGNYFEVNENEKRIYQFCGMQQMECLEESLQHSVLMLGKKKKKEISDLSIQFEIMRKRKANKPKKRKARR